MTLEHRLAAAGKARRKAERDRLAASQRLHRTVKEAAGRGWPKTRIAEAAGLSRQTVHEILKEGEK